MNIARAKCYFVFRVVTVCMIVIIIFIKVNNVQNKNADGMPPIMLFAGLLCGVSWLIYGLLLRDPNVYVSELFVSWTSVRA